MDTHCWVAAPCAPVPTPSDVRADGVGSGQGRPVGVRGMRSGEG